MDIDDAIRILDPETTGAALAEIEYYNGFSGHFAKVEACDEACEVAVAVMRAQQAAEKNDPLTLDELMEMDGKPVWIYSKFLPERSCWKVIYRIFLFQIELTDCTCLTFEGFNKDWLAYRRPPKEK